ncbi:thioredoxin-like protein [Dichotomocladium elegans]|nr:thioredoxin-like protein [Dichotomocladium elegans]
MIIKKNYYSNFSRLEHYSWNLQRAIESVYEANNSHDAAREKLEAEVASSANANSSSSSSSSETDPLNPSAAASSRTQPSRFRFSLFTLFAWPFGIAWNITWTIISFATRIISRQSITSTSTPSVSRQDPRTIAARFLHEFESKYGETHVEFFQGGYSQALETARRELRYLLVVIQSNEHDDTEAFCRETLSSEELINYIRQNNILVWGGNVHESEGFQVSSTLQATMYPFMAIIALQASSPSSASVKMAVVDRIEGRATAPGVIRRLEAVAQRHGATLNRLRMERDQREMERRVRQEQDQAYRESLKADQEKERRAREARAAAAREEEEAHLAEQERLNRAEKRQQYIRYLYRTFLEEPDAADFQGEVAKLSFRLADGERVIRKFKGDDTLETLYRFVEIYPLIKNKEDVTNAEKPTDYQHKYNFTIVSPYPKMIYEADDSKPLSGEKSLWPSATLIVDAEEAEE